MLGDIDQLKTAAFELRRNKGLSYAEIGKELGINHQTAWNYVNEVLDSFKPKAEDVERFRSMQVSRLEAVLRTLWPKVEAGDLQALDRWVKIDQRIAALRGLEIDKHEHNIGDETLAALDMNKIRQKLAEAIDRKHRDESGQGSK
jgi:transcriptional regulator with XRE-family HTH domain